MRLPGAPAPARWRAVTPALAAVLALAGCTTVPVSGPLVVGRPIDAVQGQGPRVRAQGPVEDASPQDIVRGFLAAGVDLENGRETARQFLTGEAFTRWTGEGTVVVHESSKAMVLDTPEDGAVSVTMPVSGVLDETGHLSEGDGGRRTDTFGLARVGGQWRISSLPRGVALWLSREEFDRLYVRAGIAYADPTHRVLVPDSRFFPAGRGLATALVRAQVERAPDVLRGAVVNGVPAGTTLQAASVPVTKGVARVELSSEALSAGEEERRMVWAQLWQTLSQVPGVDAVEVRAGGAPYEVPGIGETLGSPAPTGYRVEDGRVPYALVQRGSRLERVDPTDPELQVLERDSASVPLPPVPASAEGVAATFAVDQLAWVDPARTTLTRWRGGETVSLPRVGTRLTEPSFDRWDTLWLAGRSGRVPSVWRLDTAGPLRAAPERVDTPWNGSSEFRLVRASIDATRLLLVRRDPRTGVDQLGLSGIVRTASGRVRALTEPRPLNPALTEVLDATWVDADTVAVLARRSQREQPRVEIVELAGTSQALEEVPGARSLVSYPSPRGVGLLLVTDRGRVLSKSGLAFDEVEQGSGVVIPGR